MEEIDHFILAEEIEPYAVLPGLLSGPALNAVRAYIASYTAEGDTILDPFAHTDGAARVALKLGRKAILSDLSPITTFAARTLHSTITEQQMAYSLVRLAEGTKLDTSLREHICELYASVCPSCQGPVTVSHFVWSRDENKPIAKSYFCPLCQPTGGSERLATEPASQRDIEVAHRFEPKGFHYWFVLDRLKPSAGAQMALSKQALDMYTPRNLYALVTILMQIESAFDNPLQQDFLKLVLLDCMDRCAKTNVINAAAHAARSTPTPEPSRLRVPARFMERNVWETFEGMHRLLASQILLRRQEGYASRVASHVEQITWRGPSHSTNQLPNLYITQEMARYLTNEIPEGSVDLVITEPPRPERMEYLALSYVWSGWLFGSGRTQIFEHVHATRAKADWHAYFKASVSSLRGLSHAVREDGAIVLSFSSRDLTRCIALILAGVSAGLRLRRVLHLPAEGADTRDGPFPSKRMDDYVLEFRRVSSTNSSRRGTHTPATVSPRTPPVEPKAHKVPDLEHAFLAAVMHSAKALLSRRGEPTQYRWIVLACYEHLATEGLLNDALATFREEEDVFGTVRQFTDEIVHRCLRSHFLRVSEEDGPASEALWWLSRRPVGVVPISDQVEMAVYNILSTSKRTTKESIAQTIFGLFSGLLTPETGWIEDCIDSYATRDAFSNLLLRPEDSLAQRTLEHNEMVATLAQLGHEFGFKVWIGQKLHKAKRNGETLASLLSEAERNFGPESLLGGPNAAQIDVVWYEYGKHIYTFDVEWTTAFSEPVTTRGQSSQPVRRFLVVPEERVPLIHAKLARYPWLRKAIEEAPWEFIKFRHLAAFAKAETERSEFSLNKIAGLNPPVEQDAAQLRLL